MQIKNKLIFLVLIIGFILFYFFNGNDTSYTFRNAEYLKNHYNKHGLEMGFESEEEYEKRASDLINYCINNSSCLYKKEEDNDDIYYLEETNEIIKTFLINFQKFSYKTLKNSFQRIGG